MKPGKTIPRYASHLARGINEDPLAKQFHGGFYVPMDFTGDASKVP